ncbi:MAG: hypothetical protein ACLU9S_21600 [Oscillospiraceae bacterium]
MLACVLVSTGSIAVILRALINGGYIAVGKQRSQLSGDSPSTRW